LFRDLLFFSCLRSLFGTRSFGLTFASLWLFSLPAQVLLMALYTMFFTVGGWMDAGGLDDWTTRVLEVDNG
jgi:hypothetical protein